MLHNPIEDPESVDKAEPGMLSWTEELRRVAMAVSKKDRNPAANRQQLFYLLHWTADARGFGVTVHTRAAIRKVPTSCGPSIAR
jgi:hypothetical protein